MAKLSRSQADLLFSLVRASDGKHKQLVTVRLFGHRRLHPERPDRSVNGVWGWVTKHVEHGTGSYWDYCGSSSWAYGEYVELGLTAVDTLQPEAKDMAPEYLKKRFGDRLAFHGCISTAGPVAFGTVADTVTYCRRILDVMMPGGGYCFSPTHALQDNSPTENVVAMYETAHKYGRY